MGFSRQEYWRGLPFPSPGDLPDPGIEPGPPSLEADALTSEPPRKPYRMLMFTQMFKFHKIFFRKVFSSHWTQVSTQKKKKSVSRVETLCDFMDCNPPGSSVHGIFRQEYWSGLPFPSPGDLPDPGIEPRSPALEADSLLFEPQGESWTQVSKQSTHL